MRLPSSMLLPREPEVLPEETDQTDSSVEQELDGDDQEHNEEHENGG